METIEIFLKSLNGYYKENTIAGYKNDLKNFENFLFNRTEILNDKNLNIQTELELLRQLRAADIYAYITYLKNHNQNRQITINRKISALKQYFKFLRSNHYLTDNIVYDIKSNKIEIDDTLILTAEECRKLLNNISGKNKLRDTLIIMLFLFCGVTVDELIHIKKSDIGAEKILILKHNGNQEYLAINEALKSILSVFLSDDNMISSEFLFSVDGNNHISKRTIHQLIVKHLKANNFYKKGMTTETIRKTGAVFLINHCRMNLYDLQSYMGHKNIVSTKNLIKNQLMVDREQLNKNPLANIKIL